MDDRRFDQLAKAIAGETGSRREAIGLVAGSAAAAMLGLLGVKETTSARRRNRDKDDRRNRNRRRNRDRDKEVRICHCPDSNPQNCSNKRFKAKKAKRHLKQHPNDYRGKCGNKCLDVDVACNVNRPAQCCNQNCCLDTTSSTGGICASAGGRCCGQHATGGYCSEFFPQCCGQNACCGINDTCCGTPQDPNGYCCPPGQECCVSPSGCCPVSTGNSAVASEHGVRGGAPRVRAGN